MDIKKHAQATYSKDTDITGVIVGIFIFMIALLIVVMTQKFVSTQTSTSSRASEKKSTNMHTGIGTTVSWYGGYIEDVGRCDLRVTDITYTCAKDGDKEDYVYTNTTLEMDKCGISFINMCRPISSLIGSNSDNKPFRLSDASGVCRGGMSPGAVCPGGMEDIYSGNRYCEDQVGYGAKCIGGGPEVSKLTKTSIKCPILKKYPLGWQVVDNGLCYK